MRIQDLGDEQIQRELGARLHQARLTRNISQTALAQGAGLARRTLIAAETGQGTTLGSLIALLRELQMLDLLEPLITPAPMSPTQVLQKSGKLRQRASRKRAKPKAAPPRAHQPEPVFEGLREAVHEPWRWKE
jgi:putative transcriptional regulator